MLNWSERFENIRLWLDGERKDVIPENIERAEKMKSESEVFLQKLKNSIEELLKNEIARIPATNKAYIPEKFIVFISQDADNNLRADKRKFFENGLSVMIYERAAELAGTLQLTAKKINVEITANGTLDDAEIEVRAVSEDTEKTIEFVESIEQELKKNGGKDEDATIDDQGTIEDIDNNFGILYRVEVWQNGSLLNNFPIILRTNTVGRDDGANVANIKLKTDNRFIARIHAEISLEDTGEIWVTALHKNPTIVSGKPIRKGEKAKLGENGEIQIYEFLLKIKFAE